MFGEKATTDITIAKDSKGVPQLKHAAKEGGDIAKNARKELEQKIGKSVVSNENYLQLTEKKKKKLIELGVIEPKGEGKSIYYIAKTG